MATGVRGSEAMLLLAAAVAVAAAAAAVVALEAVEAASRVAGVAGVAGDAAETFSMLSASCAEGVWVCVGVRVCMCVRVLHSLFCFRFLQLYARAHTHPHLLRHLPPAPHDGARITDLCGCGGAAAGECARMHVLVRVRVRVLELLRSKRTRTR